MTASLGALVLVAVAAAAGARGRFAKDAKAATSFMLPGAAAVIAGAWLVLAGAGGVAIPVLATAGMFGAAGSIFMPTRAARFREFERRFWDHVLHHERHNHG